MYEDCTEVCCEPVAPPAICRECGSPVDDGEIGSDLLCPHCGVDDAIPRPD